MRLNLENMNQWLLVKNCTEDFEKHCREVGAGELANKVFFLNQKIAGYAVPWVMPYYYWEVEIMIEAVNCFWTHYDVKYVEIRNMLCRLLMEVNLEKKDWGEYHTL